MIRIVQKGGDGKGQNYREFIISSAADVSNLPKSVPNSNGAAGPGSVAYTQNLEHTYLLGPDDIWREV